MAQYGFLFDMTRCSGCQCCQFACKDVNDLPVGAFYREVFNFEGGHFPSVWAASLSMGCNHCSEPACAAACPVAAISKDPRTGLVTQDQSMCIVCERCVHACPYEAPCYNPSVMAVGKCDGCVSLLEIGEEPACVAACSTRSLQFGELDELKLAVGDMYLVRSIVTLPEETRTNPSILIKPKPEMMR